LEPAAHESSFKKNGKKLYVNYTSIIKKKKKEDDWRTTRRTRRVAPQSNGEKICLVCCCFGIKMKICIWSQTEGRQRWSLEMPGKGDRQESEIPEVLCIICRTQASTEPRASYK